MTDYQNIALALAGVCQSAKLIQQIATHGNCDEDALKTILYSLLQTNPANTLSVFGGNARELKIGLETLISQLTTANDQNLARYWLSLLALEGKLNKQVKTKQELGNRIVRLKDQLSYYDLFDEQMLSIIAGIYTDLISPLGRKINIIGSPLYLQQPLIQHKIRACLLAGIRSAVLWRQLGGSKWQLLFSRRKILKAAQQIYSSL